MIQQRWTHVSTTVAGDGRRGYKGARDYVCDKADVEDAARPCMTNVNTNTGHAPLSRAAPKKRRALRTRMSDSA